MSIVGVDVIPYSYYKHKLEAERLISSSDIPYTILRATQFHSLVDQLLAKLSRFPLLMPVPKRFKFQTIAEDDVVGQLVGLVDSRPLRRITNLAGPELLTLGEMSIAWKRARRITKPTVNLPLPGSVAAAFREGKNTSLSAEFGSITWSDWLSLTYMNNNPQ